MKHQFSIIILARSGSKRIPGKNFSLELYPGKTLLELALEKAKRLSSQVFLSTDKEHIAEIAEREGVKARLSPYHTDKSSSVDAVLYLAEKESLEENVVLLQVTSPLVTAKDIKKAMDAYIGRPLFAAREAKEVSWAWTACNPLFPKWQGVRSQDLPPVFLPCGAFYICSVDHLREHKSFMFGAFPIRVPKERAIDIDTLFDLEYAKWLLQLSADPQLQPSGQ